MNNQQARIWAYLDEAADQFEETGSVDTFLHDSFATHAARTDELARLLRDTFVEQYRDDVLGRFRNEIVAALPEMWKDQVPPPPEAGDLDLEMVRHSTYLFG